MDEEAQSLPATSSQLASEGPHSSDPLRRVASAVILQALSDAAAGRVEALEWLASTHSQLWLDYLDIPQSSLLLKSDWRSWAWQVSNPSPLLTSTLEYLDDLSRVR